MDAFVRAVARGLKGLEAVSTGFCAGCVQCQKEYNFESAEDAQAAWSGWEIAEDPHFSWSACRCCGSTFGGDRYDAHAVDKKNEIVHFSVCADCMLYLANGDVPENWKQHPGK